MADNKFTAMMLREEAEQELLAEAWGPEHRIAAADWRAAADHMEACEAALRASTELLRLLNGYYEDGGRKPYWECTQKQIVANETAMGA